MSDGNKIFDDLGKLMNDAAGVADGVRREVETSVKAQMERLINDMESLYRGLLEEKCIQDHIIGAQRTVG